MDTKWNQWSQSAARAVELIYESVDADRGWTPFLEQVSADFESSGAHLYLHHHTRGQFVEECLFGAAVFSEGGFEPTALSDSMLKQSDGGHRVTTEAPFNDEMTAGFGLMRSPVMGGYGPEDVERLNFLVPHVVRALRLQRRIRRLEQENDDVIAALDQLPTAALVVVAESLEIVRMNRRAERLLEGTDVLGMRRRRLVGVGADETEALRRAVGRARTVADGGSEGRSGPPQVVRLSRPARLPLEVLAVALRPRHRLRRRGGLGGARRTSRLGLGETGERTPPGRTRARALVLVYDPELRPTVDPAFIERLFDLTVTEAFVAARLAEGRSVRDIAEMRECSESTVRTHVKRVLQKTGTNRQAELVQLVLTSPALSMGG